MSVNFKFQNKINIISIYKPKAQIVCFEKLMTIKWNAKNNTDENIGIVSMKITL